MDKGQNSVDNPPSNSMGESVVPENRQALFTPQPPEATANTDSLTDQSQTAVNLSHPYFSNHPTQTFNTDTGDIILNSGEPKPKQNKRPFIIGGIILAVVVVVCVIVLAIVSGLSNNEKASNEPNEAEKKFNQFATYLLYGVSNNTLSGEYESDKTYELDRQLENDGFDEGYWLKSSELLDGAIMAADSNQNITRYLVKSLRSYKEYFNFISWYQKNGRFDEGRLLSSYLSGGTSSAKALIDNFYNKFNEIDFGIAKKYVDERKEQYNDAIEIYAIYNEMGCIHDGSVDENNCTKTVSSDTMRRFYDLSSSMSKAAISADRSLQNAVTYLKNRCWDLSEWLQNPVDERDKGDNDEG